MRATNNEKRTLQPVTALTNFAASTILDSSGYEADPRKACLRLSRFPAPLVTPAFGFSCSYGIYYMKGRHRRARFVRIEHDTQLRNFTDANCTQNIHTNTRIFRRQSGPEVLKARPSVRGGGGHVRATSTVVHGAARSQTCAGADGDVSV